MLIANIEGDELLMQAITSIRKQDYIVKYKSGAILKNNRRHDKRGLIKQLSRIGKKQDEDYTLELEYSYKPIELAIYLIDKQLRKIQHMTKCDVMNIWLGPTDGSNFRFKSAVTQPYKSNRPEKPEILTQLRNYLINIKGSRIIYGYEADDALGIYQNYNTADTIAVHCDKDIFMIPGLHFNTMTDTLITVTDPGELILYNGKIKGTGLAFFYYQMLTGDSTDTIPNIVRGFGPVKAYKALEHCARELDYLEAVCTQYHTIIGDGWVSRMLEQADLVWICRNKEETGKDYIKRRYNELMGGLL